MGEKKRNVVADSLIELWRKIISDDKSWVLFKHGTCVIIMMREDDLVAQATALMKQWGPVHVGSPAGDLSTITLKAGLGWVVTSHHNDILTCVTPEEIGPGRATDSMVGLLGRSKRDQDTQELEVLHVEDKRSTT